MPSTRPITASLRVRTASRRALGTFAMSAACFLSGCASQPAQKPDKPDVGPPPKHARPGVMWMGVNPPTDTNSNGYADSIVSTIYLFTDTGYVRSVAMPGTFRFSLLAKGGKVVREWTVANPGPQVAPIRTGVGDGYLVRVSLLDDGGTDVLAYQSAELVGSFKMDDGAEVRSTPNAVLIGKAGV